MGVEVYRSEFWRDYARILHSPSFRRLVGKTQLFPNSESDFFRNRLTHSLEVGQIAKSITKKINFENNNLNIDEDLVSAACLAHDIGHPPFGHQGEEALDECMKFDGGFEGNAQTLRILTKIEKKIYNSQFPSGINDKQVDIRVGLNLTLRTIGSVLKYDNIIPDNKHDRIEYHKLRSEEISPIKGYYKSEEKIVNKLKKKFNKSGTQSEFKTLECSIMDVADDIAYSNYDLEDAFKAGFLSPMDLLFLNDDLNIRVVESVNRRNNFTLTNDDVREILLEIYGNIFVADAEIEEMKMKEKNRRALAYFYTANAYHKSRDTKNHGANRTALFTGSSQNEK